MLLIHPGNKIIYIFFLLLFFVYFGSKNEEDMSEADAPDNHLLIPYDSQSDWPPPYVDIYRWRQQKYMTLKDRPNLIKGAKSFYATHPHEFVEHWCDTYDPRITGQGRSSYMPFIKGAKSFYATSSHMSSSALVRTYDPQELHSLYAIHYSNGTRVNSPSSPFYSNTRPLAWSKSLEIWEPPGWPVPLVSGYGYSNRVHQLVGALAKSN